MQVVGHMPPAMLSQYHLNAGGPQVLPTPPVATRKRKRAHQYTVSYSEVQEVDSDGRLREVIVIEDTPPPPTTMSPSITNNAFSASYQPPLYSAPIRTRARAAAEAQALSGSTSSAIIAPPAKKRKREPVEEVRAPVPKRAAVSSQQSYPVAPTKSLDSRSAAATDDVRIPLSLSLIFLISHIYSSFLQTSKGPVSCDDKEGHYIIVPDDMIYRRCMSSIFHSLPDSLK
jgi:dual-specificity kinase